MDLHWKQIFLRRDKKLLVSVTCLLYGIQFTTDWDHFISLGICFHEMASFERFDSSKKAIEVNATLNSARTFNKSPFNVETFVNDTTTIMTINSHFSFFRTSDVHDGSTVTASAARSMCVLLKEAWNDFNDRQRKEIESDSLACLSTIENEDYKPNVP